MKRARFLALLGILALGLSILLWVIWRHGENSQPTVKPAAAPEKFSQGTESSVRPNVYSPSRKELPGQPTLQRPTLPPTDDPGEVSHLADELNSPERTVSEDLTVVQNLLGQYRSAYGSFPAGEDNMEIINALSGNNPRKLAFIPQTHPAVGPQGALLDRWGTPYFFHLQSSQEIEIRSAGPDHEFYTVDDSLRSAR